VYAQQKATAAKLSSEASRSALPRTCTKAKTIMGLGSAMGQRADGPGCELPEGEGASRPSPAPPHHTPRIDLIWLFCFVHAWSNAKRKPQDANQAEGR
jgi:hypothetical protein